MITNRPWLLRWDIPLLLAMFYAILCSLALLGPMVRDSIPWLGVVGEASGFFLWPYPFLLLVQNWWPQSHTGWLLADLLGLGLVLFAGRFLQLWWSPWRPRGWRLWGWVIWLWYVPLLLWQGFWWGIAVSLGWATGE